VKWSLKTLSPASAKTVEMLKAQFPEELVGEPPFLSSSYCSENIVALTRYS
jgi:hypothetical protein